MNNATPLHLLFAGLLACASHAGSLESDFAQPPETTRPRCYWYWMDGQITKDGITRDLEAMKRVGIGEGYIGVIVPHGIKVPTTPRTVDKMKIMLKIAGRLGEDLELIIRGALSSPGLINLSYD